MELYSFVSPSSSTLSNILPGMKYIPYSLAILESSSVILPGMGSPSTRFSSSAQYVPIPSSIPTISSGAFMPIIRLLVSFFILSRLYSKLLEQSPLCIIPMLRYLPIVFSLFKNVHHRISTNFLNSKRYRYASFTRLPSAASMASL